MGKEKHGILHSQISGTIWFAVALIAILACVFFFFPQHRSTQIPDSKEQKNIANLQKKEDSVYLSRRTQYPSEKSQQRPSRSRYANPSQRHNQNTYPSNVPTTYYSTESPAPTRQPLYVELNSADTTTLQLLHGIGPTFARRIVKYREKLGGFTSTDQLLEVYGFTPKLLNHIRPHLRLNTDGLQKININKLTIKQLIKHPYMDYYFARDLVNLRSHGIIFSSPDDLRTIPSCNDTLLARLLPYLDFSH